MVRGTANMYQLFITFKEPIKKTHKLQGYICINIYDGIISGQKETNMSIKTTFSGDEGIRMCIKWNILH